MTMPFGKHAGCEIEDLPTDYLNWIFDNIELREPLCTIARSSHPDTGGSNGSMVHLNAIVASLRQQILGLAR